MNPQRLATKRLIPGFFRVQKDINIAGRTFDGVGNVALLHAEHYLKSMCDSILFPAIVHCFSRDCLFIFPRLIG